MKTGTRTSRGFTLIEILLVILILGMLASVFIVVVAGQREGTRRDTTKLLVETTVPGELEKYNMNIGHYPTEEEGGLKALLTKPSFTDETLADKWRGPYLKSEPKDAWGRLLHYELVETGTAEAGKVPFKVWSDGPDGQSGTDDDIRNWSEEAG